MKNELSNVIVRIRVIATLVIVAFHCTCPYYAWQDLGGGGGNLFYGRLYDKIFLHILCQTMLPTFFMISGMLFYAAKDKYKDRLATFWKKFDRLMVPYTLIFTLAAWLNLPAIGSGSANGHLWFVRELFIIFCFSLLMYKVAEKWLIFLGILMYACFTMQSRLGFATSEIPTHLLMFYIFFIGGHYAVKYFYLLRRRWVALAITLLWLVAVILDVQTAYKLLFNMMLLAIIPGTEVKGEVTKSINKNSFGIYLIHHLFIFAIYPIPFMTTLYADHPIVAPITMFSLSLAFSWIVSEGLKRVTFKYI